ncbi:MAG: hypothetical protein P8K78_00930 [Pirellulales bacterium]|nr:hypothetical protein [Pirellulales bacterium]
MQIHLRPHAAHAAATHHPEVTPERLGGEYGDWRIRRYLGQQGEVASYAAFPLDSPAQSEYILHTPVDPTAEIAMLHLRREWAISRRVASPHLLPVLDAQLKIAPYFLVRPKLQGTTLSQLLMQQNRVSSHRAFWILRQIAQAVDVLHTHGWLNPALEMENMLLAPDGHLTIIHAGRAEFLETHAVAFEQRTYTDICSLGGLLLEFLGLSDTDAPRERRSPRRTEINSSTALTPPITDLLTWMLSRNKICHSRSAAQLVRRLIRLEVQSLPLAA